MCPRSGEGSRAQDFQVSEITMCDCVSTILWTRVITHLSKPMEDAAPRVNPKLNSGLGVMMGSQCQFIDCNTCIALVWDADSGGGHVCGDRSYMVTAHTFCSALLYT